MPIWSGSYGGGLFLKGNNATSARYAQLAIVDSTGAIAQQGLTVNNTGNVNIGMPSGYNAEGRLHVYKGASGKSYAADAADQLIVENSGSAMIDIRTPNGNTGGILFSDSDGRGRGVIQYAHGGGDTMYFNTASAERMNLSHNGLVMSVAVKAADVIAKDSGGLSLQTDEGTKRIVIADSGPVTMPTQTYAQGRGNTGWSSFSSGAWNIQPHGSTPVMSSNRGSAYNTSNKRFTAPVAGVYLVQASWYVKQTTAASPASQYIHPGLYVNGLIGWNGGQQAYQIFGHEMNRSGTATKHYEGVSISYTLYLSAGDYVEIRVYSPNASPQSYEYYHYFSYALLY